MPETLRLLLLSDLHCHRFDQKPIESFLLAGGPRLPALNHPVDALLAWAKETGTTADAVLVAGDLANKVCQLGLSAAIPLLEEVGTRIGAAHIVTTLGNHDVDSRHETSTDAFKLARSLHPRFPLQSAAHSLDLLAKGYTLVPLSAEADLVIINTVVDHTNEESAKRGRFDVSRLEQLREFLVSHPPPLFRLALMHHHPLLHSSPTLGDRDVLETGDALLAILTEAGCNLLIHGHKHHPRFTYADTGKGRLPVFAAGSFSALLKELGSRTRNVFHVIELSTRKSKGRRSFGGGTIRSWEWRLGFGWTRASRESCDFPHLAGFGFTGSLQTIGGKIQRLSQRSPDVWIFPWATLKSAVPELCFLTPQEQEELATQLATNCALRLEPRAEGYELAKLV